MRLVRHQHVGGCDKLEERGSADVGTEVDRRTELVARGLVEPRKAVPRPFARVAVRVAPRDRGEPRDELFRRARRVAAGHRDEVLRRLDPDHLGAEVAEHHRPVRAGEDHAEVEYADALERQRARVRLDRPRRPEPRCALMRAELRRGPRERGRRVCKPSERPDVLAPADLLEELPRREMLVGGEVPRPS